MTIYHYGTSKKYVPEPFSPSGFPACCALRSASGCSSLQQGACKLLQDLPDERVSGFQRCSIVRVGLQPHAYCSGLAFALGGLLGTGR